MDFIKTIAIIAAGILSVIGILGGILSLPESYKRFRKGFYPHGKKGTNPLVLSRKIKGERQFVTWLIIGDVFHFITAFLQPKEWEGEFESIEQIGEYYKIVISYPKDQILTFTKVKRNTR